MTDETTYVTVLVATGSRDEARQLAQTAVQQKLAACAQVLPIESIYEWQGAVQQDDEYLLLLKTRRDAYPELEAALRAQHSYEVPEIIALPIVAGLDAYLDWMTEVVGQRSA